MNDPQFVEAARHLAQNALLHGGDSTESRLDFLAKRLLGRPFRAEELPVVQASLNDLLGLLRRPTPTTPKQLLAVGESKPDPSLDRRHAGRLDHAGQRTDEPGRSAEQSKLGNANAGNRRSAERTTYP